MHSVPSFNARVGSVVLLIGSLVLAWLTIAPEWLVPLRIFTLMLITFGAWAFCDEMGMRKPLNRAGFVLLVFAIGARTHTLLSTSSANLTQYYILYAFALTGAVLFWSVAFLHRDKKLKIVGAAGAVVTITPIILLIIGHVVVGTGATYGITSLFAALEDPSLTDESMIYTFEYIFAVWGVITSITMWLGFLSDSSKSNPGLIPETAD